MTTVSRQSTSARLLAPSPALVSCVRAYVSRSTLGVALRDDQRLSHFPVNPTCTLTWFMHGRLDGLQAQGQPAVGPLDARCVFSGPYTVPSLALNRTPVQSFMCMLMPDALHALCGLLPAAWCNRSAPLDEVLDASWQAMSRAVLTAADDAQRVASIEAFLMPRWRAVHKDVTRGARRYSDWTRALALRAAGSDIARGIRQSERRIKRWAGLPLRDLRFMGQAEALLLEARAALEQGELAWPELAATAGFADQAHMCRATRRASGLSPAALRQRIAEDESFWIYRIWD